MIDGKIEVSFNDAMNDSLNNFIDRMKEDISKKIIGDVVEKSMSIKGKTKAQLIDLKLKSDDTIEFITVKIKFDNKIFNKKGS